VTALLLLMLAGPHYQGRANAAKVVRDYYPLTAWVVVASERHPDPDVRHALALQRQRLRTDLMTAALIASVFSETPPPAWLHDLDYAQCQHWEYVLKARLDWTVYLVGCDDFGHPTANAYQGVVRERNYQAWRQ
jgi:hypothetical protein